MEGRVLYNTTRYHRDINHWPLSHAITKAELYSTNLASGLTRGENKTVTYDIAARTPSGTLTSSTGLPRKQKASPLPCQPQTATFSSRRPAVRGNGFSQAQQNVYHHYRPFNLFLTRLFFFCLPQPVAVLVLWMDAIASLGGGCCMVLITFSQEHIVTYGVRIRRLVGHKSNAPCQGKASREEGEHVADGGSQL